MHPSKIIYVFLFGVAFVFTNVVGAADAASKKPNVLFIAVDDLNHWVGYLGRNVQTKTPNIDRLAARGVRFTRSYCLAPVCNGSRAALMSGLRPNSTGVYANNDDWRPAVPVDLCLTTTFRNAGYFTGGAGKIYHGGFDRQSEWETYLKNPGGDPKPQGNDGVGQIKFAPLDCRDEDLQDYHIANWAIEQLGHEHDKPFFLACGLHKPHMPWNVPQKYYDMFPADSIKLPPTQEGDLKDVPTGGIKMAKPTGDHAAILASGRWKEAVQGYLAAIAYTDMNIGRVLDALDKSKYRDNTIIVFWGDHGWNLGEKEHWRKFALWEEATRAPLIWVVPGVTPTNAVCERTVDFGSIYPTLCELSGIAIPTHVQGTSIRPLLAKPDTTWDIPAVTTFGQNNHAIRTEKWRYIRYDDGGEELYDETKDPYEWKNLAADPQFAKVKDELKKHLPTDNKSALGKGDAPKKAGQNNNKNKNKNKNKT